MLRLWIKDKRTGKVHEYGTNPHDALILDDWDNVLYFNLQTHQNSAESVHYAFCTEDGGELQEIDDILYLHIANPENASAPDPQKEFDEAREENEFKVPEGVPIDQIRCGSGGGKLESTTKNIKQTIKEACDEYAATAWEKMTEFDLDENLDEAPKFHKIPFSPEDKKMLFKKFFRDLGMEVYDDKQPKPNQYPHFTFTLEPENEKRFGEICNELIKLYTQKNHDYGDSFHQSYVEEGLAMARIRLGDKFNRFKTLTKNPDGQQVNDESVKDTLKDMACYAIMTLAELERETEGKTDENCEC